jgi:hypothetical protein
MLWETIKKVLQKHGGTCIIVEEGKPAYVVTGFSDYEDFFQEKKTVLPKSAPGGISEQELLEKINQEIANWKSAQTEQQAADLLEAPGEEVKIEDLLL